MNDIEAAVHEMLLIRRDRLLVGDFDNYIIDTLLFRVVHDRRLWMEIGDYLDFVDLVMYAKMVRDMLSESQGG